MQMVLWGSVVVAACALSYVTQFAGATLSMGRALSESDSGRGFQDAITPPWQTNLALFVHIAVLLILGLVFWKLGWKSGLMALAATFVVSVVVRRFLPSSDGQHFRHLILRSMANRYADYVRNGDTVRADAMKSLLQRAGE